MITNSKQSISYPGTEILSGGWYDLNVLIIDDSVGLQERLAEMLSGVAGLKIVGQALSVVEGHRAIRELQPDLVVLDLQLGDGNGIEILRETKRTNPSIRFVIFTNHCEPLYRQRCSDLGADFFLCKSTDARSLVALSGNLVANEGN